MAPLDDLAEWVNAAKAASCHCPLPPPALPGETWRCPLCDTLWESVKLLPSVRLGGWQRTFSPPAE